MLKSIFEREGKTVKDVAFIKFILDGSETWTETAYIVSDTPNRRKYDMKKEAWQDFFTALTNASQSEVFHADAIGWYVIPGQRRATIIFFNEAAIDRDRVAHAEEF